MRTPNKATAHLGAAPGPQFTNPKRAVKVPSAGNLCATDRFLRARSGGCGRAPGKSKFTVGAYFGRMNNLLDALHALHALRPLWVPSLVVILAALIGLILISI